MTADESAFDASGHFYAENLKSFKGWGANNIFPYKPSECPGRPWRSSDNKTIGCSLCGTKLTLNVETKLSALTVANILMEIHCGVVRNICGAILDNH